MDTEEPVASATKTSATRVSKARSGVSKAGRWNSKVLNRLTVALEQDPAADMFALLTPMYSKKLQSLKKTRKPLAIIEQFCC